MNADGQSQNQPGSEPLSSGWSEVNSQQFIDYGKYFVPDRPRQIETFLSLVPDTGRPIRILELCCGEGLLAEALLERFPHSRLEGMDGSPQMLARAGARLARFGDRFQAFEFDLADLDWRTGRGPFRMIVSSLAIHHLDGPAKQGLYRDMAGLLEPGGMLVISDLVLPTNELGLALAAREWDETVHRQAIALDGHSQAYDAFQQQGWNYFRYPDPMDMPSPLFDQLQWLEAASLEGVDVFWLFAGHAIFGARKPAG
jgi:tRNA (cmo5U34)-methyltransferase